MESLWEKKQGKIFNISETENKNDTWGVIVVGGGLAGLLTAYYLAKDGRNVLVIEANKIASGQTGKTTAKITSQHGLKYTELISKVGMKKARLYANANQSAIEEYEKLIKENNIDCDFKRVPAYLYSLSNEEVINTEAVNASILGIDAVVTKETELPFEVKSAVKFNNQAMFSPLKLVDFLAKRVNVEENAKVLKVKGHKVYTQNKIYYADKIVIATHYPILKLPGLYFLRQHQERSYVLAMSGCGNMQGMYYGVDENGLSFRQAGEYLLVGGCGARTGCPNNSHAYDKLLKEAKKYYPDSEEYARWSAQDCMPHDGIPFIGKYCIFTPNIYVITGFQKWGMTSSMVAAKIIRDEINGRSNPYKKLFSPQRLNIRASYKKLLKDIVISMKGLSLGWSNKAPHRCTHLGCGLVWNDNEKSWDCPCHGSRFNVNGKVIDDPAKEDLK